MTITNHVFDKEITIKAKIGYKLFVPQQYDSIKSWPLIVFLHGIKKRGSDISVLDNYGLLKYAMNNPEFPFLVLAPQCPSNAYWPVVRNEVICLINQVQSDYSVDRRKVYVTGFSMGGNGAWDLAVYTSGIFSAAVPIAGWYEKEAASLINIPVWAFHGEDDDVVPLSGSTDMVSAMKDTGKEVELTRYPGMKHEHEVMNITFSNPELYKWLLSKES